MTPDQPSQAPQTDAASLAAEDARDSVEGEAATPLDRRRRRVRDLILDGAEGLFAEHGLEGLTVRRIAERIDYSPGAIYQYFASKEEILEEIRELFFTRLLKRIDDVTAGRPMSIACMRDGLRAYIECGLELPNHYRMAFADGAAGPPREGSRMFEAARRLEGIIASGVEEGLFRRLDPTLAAKSVWPCLHGLTQIFVQLEHFPYAMPGAEHYTRGDVIDFHIDLLLRGMSAVEPEVND